MHAHYLTKRSPLKKFAFSLIELSVVILIIGILIAGVLQGSRLTTKARIKTARLLTESSPVISIKGLLFWVEPTSHASFANDEVEDGAMISVWYDINPQQTLTSYLTPGVDVDEPKTLFTKAITYEENSPIGNLPSILFAPDLATSDTEIMMTKSEAITTPFNAFTFCALYKSTGTTTQYVIANGSNHTYGNFSHSFSKFSGVFRLRSNTAGTNYSLSMSYDKINLHCSSYAGIENGRDGAVKSYINGKEKLSNNHVSGIASPTGKLYVGALAGKNSPFHGYLSELIVYDRALRLEEIQSVEKYLIQKYNLKIDI